MRQPVEPEIGVAERELNERELERRHVAALGQRFELAQNSERRLPLASDDTP